MQPAGRCLALTALDLLRRHVAAWWLDLDTSRSTELQQVVHTRTCEPIGVDLDDVLVLALSSSQKHRFKGLSTCTSLDTLSGEAEMEGMKAFHVLDEVKAFYERPNACESKPSRLCR